MTQFMAANVIDISRYAPKSSDIFFFDNNVWMYLFCPLGSYEQDRQNKYSAFLKEVKSSRGTIFLSSLILSEFVNRYLRLDFNQWKSSNSMHSAEFKRDYVKSDRYPKAVEIVKPLVSKILSICDKTPDNFNSLDIHQVLTHTSFVDFNDSYFIELLSKQNWKLVTDDSDFSNYSGHNLTVITYR